MKRYIKASFSSSVPSWLTKDKSAVAALNQAGVDLHNATFSAEKTGKVGDNIVIYRIKQPSAYQQRDSYKRANPDAEINYNEFIWIPGIYNDDHYVSFINYDRYDPYMHDYKTSDKAVKYFPKKDLNIIDTIYVYSAGANIKSPRKRYIDPRYDEYGNYLGQQMIPGDWHWEGNEKVTEPGHWSKQGVYYGRYDRYPDENPFRDKSGYTIPNPKDRLKEFYESPEGMNKRIKIVRKQLDSIYSQLEDAKENIFNFVLPRGEREDYRKYRSLYEYLDSALSYYEKTLERLEKLERHSSQGTLDRWDNSDIEYALNDLERAQKYIDNINKTLGLNG